LLFALISSLSSSPVHPKFYVWHWKEEIGSFRIAEDGEAEVAEKSQDVEVEVDEVEVDEVEVVAVGGVGCV
jgi:hypothetical protein